MNKIKFSRVLKEIGFKIITLLSLVFAISMVIIIIGSVALKGYTAFFTNYLVLNLDKSLYNTQDVNASLSMQLNNNIKNTSVSINPNTIKIEKLISGIEFAKYAEIFNGSTQSKISKNFLLVSNLDMYLKGHIKPEDISVEDRELLQKLVQSGLIQKKINIEFFTNSDSRYTENAGIKSAIVGSLYVVGLTTIFAVVLSVGAAIYLQEFVVKNTRFVNIVNINITNLAAIPSIIFGLLGLVIFENFFGVPRGTPLLASLILTLMALPTIIITTKIALSNVPNTIKEASYGLGASKLQVILLHSLPMSLPGILTGVIISISRTIGETAPLLMIGMVSFTNNVPSGVLDNALVFPVQILLWFNNPEPGYAEKASGAILILLIILFIINFMNSLLRNWFEKKYK